MRPSSLGNTFTSSATAAAYRWSLRPFVGIALVVGRVVTPLRRNAYHQFRVTPGSRSTCWWAWSLDASG
jgi:hypothetical protein